MPHIESPLVYSKRLSARLGANVFYKMDLLQPSQSFKTRGIAHFCQKALEKAPSRDELHFVVASGGNAALACSSEAAAFGVKCSVFIPKGVPTSTVQALQSDGSTVTESGSEFVHALAAAEEAVAADPGAVLIPAYDHPDIWEGHATLVYETQRQLSQEMDKPVEPDAMLVSCGGGGLLGGIIVGARNVGWEKMQIVAVESQGADALVLSLEQNKAWKKGDPLKVVTLDQVRSKISSLGARAPSAGVLEMALERGVTAITITDDQARQAGRQFADEEKILPELACAAALTPAYMPEVLAIHMEGWTKSEWQPGQKWNVRPDPKLRNIVFVACGGAKVSVDEASAWPRLS